MSAPPCAPTTNRTLAHYLKRLRVGRVRRVGRRPRSHWVPLYLALLLAFTVPGLASAQARAPGSSRVMALRQATLKSGVSAAEFERYFADSVARPLARHVPGVRAYLLKGERGAQVGGYVMVWEFDSLNRRNEYFPKPDSASGRWSSVSRALPPRAMDDLAKYVDAPTYTDYVVVR